VERHVYCSFHPDSLFSLRTVAHAGDDTFPPESLSSFKVPSPSCGICLGRSLDPGLPLGRTPRSLSGASFLLVQCSSRLQYPSNRTPFVYLQSTTLLQSDTFSLLTQPPDPFPRTTVAFCLHELRLLCPSPCRLGLSTISPPTSSSLPLLRPFKLHFDDHFFTFLRTFRRVPTNQNLLLTEKQLV